MATGYLSISPTSITATSSWTVYGNQGGGYNYSDSTTPYVSVSVSIPSAMSGASFNSVSFTYNQSGGNGWSAPYFQNSNTVASDSTILDRLRKSQSVNLTFRFKANGGYGSASIGQTVTKSETRTFSNIKILVDYTPPGKIGKTVTVTNCGTCEIRLNDVSMAAGESGTATLIATPTKAITKIVAKIRVGSSGHVETYTITKSVSANNTTSTSFTLAPLAAWFDANDPRVNDTYVQFVFTSGGTDYSSSWTQITDSTYGDFKLLKARSAPVISNVTFTEPTGTTTHISTYGNPIAGKTLLDVSFSVALDTSADSGISQSGASFTINNVTYTPNNNACSLQPVNASGSVSYTISVTDSYGQVGTLSSTQTFLSYAAPTMTDVSVARYTTDIDQGGSTIYVLSDDSTTVWLNADIAVQTTLGTGTNAWRLDYTMDGGSSTNIYSNQTTSSVTLDKARGLITDTVSATDDHTFVITLSDQFTSFVATVVVSKAGAIFDIAPGGVAVGMRCTGTENGGEKFQVAYPSELIGNTSITNLANLNGKVYDTGWVSLRDYILTAEVNVRDDYFDIRRIGNIVHLRMGVTTKKTYSSSTWYSITTAIPSQFWPSVETFISSYSQKPGGYLGINASGVIRLRNQTGSSQDSGFWVYGMGSYTVG